MLRITAALLSTCLIFLSAAWGVGALWFQAPGGRVSKRIHMLLWGAACIACIGAIWLGHWGLGASAFAIIALGFALWWRTLEPAENRSWADDVAQITSGCVEGDIVTLQNVRNFSWTSETEYLQRWETRTYSLPQLNSMDMIMSYWRGRAIAHMLISFGFDNGDYVAFSVEVRRKRNEGYSELGGFFKDFELSIIAADERDVVRLRTNVRREEDYLYHIHLPVAAIRGLFLAYIEQANKLVQKPRFYNTITVNCTTLVYRMLKRIVGKLPFSWRVLISGYMPEYMYSIGGLDQRHSLEQLRSLGYISERARRSDLSPTFSADIRRGLPRI